MSGPVSTIEKIANIERMIAIVRGKVASIPSIDDAGDISVQAAEKRVKLELTREFGASFSFHSGGYRLSLAGVGGTCTSGYSGLFRNWEMAARRKIMMLRVVARGTAGVVDGSRARQRDRGTPYDPIRKDQTTDFSRRALSKREG